MCVPKTQNVPDLDSPTNRIATDVLTKNVRDSKSPARCSAKRCYAIDLGLSSSTLRKPGDGGDRVYWSEDPAARRASPTVRLEDILVRLKSLGADNGGAVVHTTRG